MRMLMVLLPLIAAGCAARGAVSALPAAEGTVQAISVAPLATCVGVVQQSQMLLNALATGQASDSAGHTDDECGAMR